MTDTEDNTIAILKYGKCTGLACKGKGIGTEPHPCPFSLEMGDEESSCNCCEECEISCSDDI